MGYYKQEGIVGGNYGQSNYERLSMRSNNIYNVLDASKDRNFLNKLDVTVNMAYTRVKSTGIDANSNGSVLGSALYLAPTLAPTVTNSNVAKKYYNTYEDPNTYDADGNITGTRDTYELLRDANGNYYTIPGMGGTYQEMNNPLAMMARPAAKNWSHKFVPKFSIDLQLWDNLKYHSLIVQTSASGVQIATPHPSITSLVTSRLSIPRLTRVLTRVSTGRWRIL